MGDSLLFPGNAGYKQMKSSLSAETFNQNTEKTLWKKRGEQ